MLRLISLLAIHFVLCTCYQIRNITLAGVFSVFDITGASDIVQLEQLSAFVLAVSNINRKYSQIYSGIHINYVIYHANGSPERALEIAEKIVSSPVHIDGVVSGLSYDEIAVMNTLFSLSGHIVVTSFENSAYLSSGDKFPYLFSMVPLSSYGGYVAQSVMCNLNAVQLLILVEDDKEGIDGAFEVTSGEVCSLSNQATITFPSNTRNFSHIISTLSIIDPTLIYVSGKVETVSSFAIQAFNVGFFRKGRMFMVPERLTTYDVFQYIPDTANYPVLLQSIIGMQYWSTYTWNSDESNIFLNDWVAQPSSLNNCSKLEDSFGNKYLTNQLGTCTGLDFSSYVKTFDPYFIEKPGYNIQFLTKYAYDSVFVFANAYSIALKATDQQRNNSIFIRDVILNNTLTGTTGVIGFRKGFSFKQNYGRGNRNLGLQYLIFQLRGANNLSPIDLYPSYALFSGGILLNCSQLNIPCSNPNFYTLDGKFSNGLAPYARANLNSYIKIGSLFAPLSDSVDTVDTSQVHMLAAFLMAINEINNKADGIADNLLPSSQLLFDIGWGTSYSNALYDASYILKGSFSTVTAVVNGLSGDIALSTQRLYSSLPSPILEIDVITKDSSLSDPDKYPYKIEMSPLNSYDGNVISSLLCLYFKYKNVAVLLSPDADGSNSIFELENNAICGLNILTYQIIQSRIEQSQLDQQLDVVKQSGARIIILFLSPSVAASTIQRGRSLGIFGSDSLLILSSVASSGIASKFSQQDLHSIQSALKGVITINYWPGGLLSTSKGQSFVQRWRNQMYRGEYSINSKSYCDQSVDDSGKQYLFLDNTDLDLCYGLNYTSFKTDGSDIHPYAFLTYDTVYTLARGYDSLISSGIPVTGTNLHSSILKSSYEGITGQIKFTNSREKNQYQHQGERNEGIFYQVLNFDINMFVANSTNPLNAFSMVGYWDSSTSLFSTDCSALSATCKEIEYSTSDNLPPSDTLPDILITLPLISRAILWIMFCMSAPTAVWFIVETFKNRSDKYIRANQPEMLVCSLIGALALAFRVLVGAIDLSDAVCSAEYWLQHFGFVLMVGSLLIKTYRIHSIMSLQSLKTKKFDKRRALEYLALACLLSTALLIINQAIGNPRLGYVSETSHNQTTRRTICYLEHEHVNSTIFVLEAVMVLYGVFLCYVVRDIPDAVNESKSIAGSFLFIALLFSLVLPATYFVQIDAQVKQFVISISVGLTGLVTMLLVFVPKFMLIYDSNNDSKIMPYSNNLPDESKKNKPLNSQVDMRLVPLRSPSLKTPSYNRKTPSRGMGSGKSAFSRSGKSAYSKSGKSVKSGLSGLSGSNKTPKQPFLPLLPSQFNHKTIGINITGLSVYYDSTEIAKSVFKKLAYDEKETFCLDQISKWQTMILKVQNHEDGESSIASSSIESDFDLVPSAMPTLPRQSSTLGQYTLTSSSRANNSVQDSAGHAMPLSRQPSASKLHESVPLATVKTNPDFKRLSQAEIEEIKQMPLVRTSSRLGTFRRQNSRPSSFRSAISPGSMPQSKKDDVPEVDLEPQTLNPRGPDDIVPYTESTKTNWQ